MKQRTKKIGYRLILLWMFWPLIPPLISSVIALVCGCKVDEGSVHPCLVFGMDIGGLLHIMGVIGLIGIGTFPSGLILLVVFRLIVWWSDRTADVE